MQLLNPKLSLVDPILRDRLSTRTYRQLNLYSYLQEGKEYLYLVDSILWVSIPSAIKHLVVLPSESFVCHYSYILIQNTTNDCCNSYVLDQGLASILYALTSC